MRDFEIECPTCLSNYFYSNEEVGTNFLDTSWGEIIDEVHRVYCKNPDCNQEIYLNEERSGADY